MEAPNLLLAPDAT